MSIIPDTFTLLSSDTITDIGLVTSALMLFLGTILVAKSIIFFFSAPKSKKLCSRKGRFFYCNRK